MGGEAGDGTPDFTSRLCNSLSAAPQTAGVDLRQSSGGVSQRSIVSLLPAAADDHHTRESFDDLLFTMGSHHGV